MAIYIQLNRIDDGPDLAVYEFGTVEQIVGQVAIDKRSGEIVILELVPHHPNLGFAFYFPRISRVLTRHFEADEYPPKIHYAA